MTLKIELGFTDIGSGAPFFTVGNAVKGVIGNTDFVIGGGEVFVDVTEYLQSLTINRGKSRELERFNAGQLTANFVNNQRYFDPTYEDSPFFGQIVPKRSVKVTLHDEIQYVGIIDDWDIVYDPSGYSVSTLVAFDALAQLSNLNLYSFEPAAELSGTRVNNALNNVSWSTALRDIDSGLEVMEAQTVQDGAGLADYLTTIEQSEVGFLFISKAGNVKFVGRTSGYSVSPITFADDGSGIPYTNAAVNYGSELLYNDITLTSGAGTAVASSDESKAFYGARELQRTTFIAEQVDLQKIAGGLLGKYKDPEYRFSNITVELDSLPLASRESLATLELGDIVSVVFTPSDIPPAINRIGRIVGISQSHQPLESVMVISLESVLGVPLIIGSAEFGIIGVGTVGF